jgi:hypothetical protein
LSSTTFLNLNSNYNNYWSTGARDGGFRTGSLAITAFTDYADLATFAAAVSDDANSQELDPLFADASNDLHTCALQNIGTPIAGITDDYDCQSRSATTPAIGADECPPLTAITVNLKLFLQGYYIDGGIMQPVLNNQAVAGSGANETDTITVELHHETTFALIDTKQAVLLTNGTASATFTQPAGSYFIAIKHRNTIQTWSAGPVSCVASTPLYDFTTAANKAMGGVQVEVQTGKWAMYTGDLNQDDFIDGNDFPAFDNDSLNGVNAEYVATDMNGDGFVDGNDFPVFDSNSFNGISGVHP